MWNFISIIFFTGMWLLLWNKVERYIRNRRLKKLLNKPVENRIYTKFDMYEKTIPLSIARRRLALANENKRV